jgi:hypothetical protein
VAPATERVGSWSRFHSQTEAFLAVAQRIHLGPLIAGIALVVFGLLILGGTQVAWRGLLDLMLFLVGVALIFRSLGAGASRGLLVLGVFLGAVMLTVWWAAIPLQGGMRFTTVTPSPADPAPNYHVTAGWFTIDLVHYPIPASTVHINASMGVGRLVVVVPPGMVVGGNGTVGAGRVVVGQTSKNGAEVVAPLAPQNAAPHIVADLRVGIGTAEVQVGKP